MLILSFVGRIVGLDNSEKCGLPLHVPQMGFAVGVVIGKVFVVGEGDDKAFGDNASEFEVTDKGKEHS